jgi:hypothetical protein
MRKQLTPMQMLETGRPPHWPFRDHYDANGKLHRAKPPKRTTKREELKQIAQEVGPAPF